MRQFCYRIWLVVLGITLIWALCQHSPLKCDYKIIPLKLLCFRIWGWIFSNEFASTTARRWKYRIKMTEETLFLEDNFQSYEVHVFAAFRARELCFSLFIFWREWKYYRVPLTYSWRLWYVIPGTFLFLTSSYMKYLKTPLSGFFWSRFYERKMRLETNKFRAHLDQ